MFKSSVLFASAAILALGGCSQGEGAKSAGPAPSPPPSPAPTAAPAGQDAAPGLSLQAINGAQFAAPATSPQGSSEASGNATSAPDTASGGDKTPSAALIKAEVLLARANVSPGVIDGRMGENVRNAFSAYQAMHHLQPSGQLDQATWDSLTAADKTPVLKSYTVTAADVAGPWSPDVGENFVKLADDDKATAYHSPQELLAERFHMDEDLLKTLNPAADPSEPGTVLVVVDPGQGALPSVDHVEVDKAKEEVIAYGGDGAPVAVFPATVGSTERPSPKGTWKVKGVAQNPDYVYNPAKLHWGPRHAGKLHIAPGPNNPVGVVWIALTAPDYGIHGTPDPHLVGKTASHGCIRLTNWDAETLSKAVRPGVKVTFVTS